MGPRGDRLVPGEARTRGCPPNRIYYGATRATSDAGSMRALHLGDRSFHEQHATQASVALLMGGTQGMRHEWIPTKVVEVERGAQGPGAWQPFGKGASGGRGTRKKSRGSPRPFTVSHTRELEACVCDHVIIGV